MTDSDPERRDIDQDQDDADSVETVHRLVPTNPDDDLSEEFKSGDDFW